MQQYLLNERHRIMIKTIALPTLTALTLMATNALAFEAKDYHGKWKTEAKGEETKTATVDIAPCDNNTQNLCGKIVGLDEPLDPETNLPKKDKKNKDKSLRDRPIMGLQMISDLKPQKNGKGYEDGEIYSPKTGKTYRASMKLKDQNTLNVKGHVFIFSSTQTWTRVQD